jgi:hypothetical protein
VAHMRHVRHVTCDDKQDVPLGVPEMQCHGLKEAGRPIELPICSAISAGADTAVETVGTQRPIELPICSAWG